MAAGAGDAVERQLKITVTRSCGAKLSHRRGDTKARMCPKNGTREIGGRWFCAQHHDSVHWEACAEKRKAIVAVALRLAEMVDAIYASVHGSVDPAEIDHLHYLQMLACSEASARRAQIWKTPAEQWCPWKGDGKAT